MKTTLAILIVLFLAVAGSARATIVYSNSFNSSADWTKNTPSNWYQVNFNSGGGGKARIRNSGTHTGTNSADRWACFYKTVPLAATNEFDPLLDNSTWPIVWSLVFNNAFGSSWSTVLTGNVVNGGAEAHGFVIGATSPDFRNAGNGYALVQMDGLDGGNQSALHFIRYTGGLIGSVTSLLTWTAADAVGLDNIGGAQCAMKLIFDPGSGQWTLAARTGMAGSYNDWFTNPLVIAYLPAETKSIVDTMHTGESLGDIGMFLSNDENVPQVYIDNLLIQTIPEPVTAVGGAVVLLALARRR